MIAANETSYKVRQARKLIRKVETLIQEASNLLDERFRFVRSRQSNRPALHDAKAILVVDAPYVEKDGRYHQDRNEVADVKRALRWSGAFESGDGLLLFVVTRCDPEILEYFALPKYQTRVRVAITPVATVAVLNSTVSAIRPPMPMASPAPSSCPWVPSNSGSMHLTWSRSRGGYYCMFSGSRRGTPAEKLP